MKRVDNDDITKRATPIEWASYCIASTAMRLYNESDTRITDELRSSAYTNDRLPYRARFFDTSKLKIGKQTLKNMCVPVVPLWFH